MLGIFLNLDLFHCGLKQAKYEMLFRFMLRFNFKF